MRIFTTIIAFFLIGNVFGQIELKSLDYNPVLKQNLAQKRAIQSRNDFLLHNRIPNRGKSVQRDSEIFYPQHVVMGDTLKFDIDTLDQGQNVWTLLNAPDVTTLDSFSVKYVPASVDFWREDSIFIQTCFPGGMCDTLIYPIVTHRQNIVVQGDETILAAFETREICFSEFVDTLDYLSTELLNCGEDDFRTQVTIADSCLLYEAGGFSETDDLCVVVCNNHWICDTIKFHVVVTQDTLSGLPFFDDFSYDGPYASQEKWITPDVFVNQTLGINPPSIGVASFDGVSGNGAAYGTSFGVSDVMVSKYIDISNFASNDGINLVFFLQPKGLAYSGPKDKDLFILEFKDSSGEWITQGEWSAADADFSKDAFTKIVMPVNKSEFVHSSFQFRFSNLSKRTGFISIWNLDYVLLDKIEANAEIKDVAFTTLPSSLLKQYEHMPLTQFIGNEANEIADNIDIGLYSQFETEVAAEPSTFGVTELVNGSEILTDEELLFLDGTTNQRNVPSNTVIQYSNSFNNKSSLVNSLISDFSGQDSIVLELNYNFKQSSESNLTKSNNSVKKRTFLTDFYAYDDGSPEGNMTAAGQGTEILLKFHANTPDTLKSVQFFIPHINGDITKQSFNIKVYGADLSLGPVYESNKVNPIYADGVTSSILSFTNYKLKDSDTGEDSPIVIPTGDFYVGWEQLSDNTNNAITIGFDLNNNEVANMIYRSNANDDWRDFLASYPGVVMIRPVFSKVAEPTTAIDDLSQLDDDIQIYPNPNDGFFQVELKTNDFDNFKMEIYNGLGQLIRKGKLSPTIDLSQQMDGIYLLNILNVTTGDNKTIQVVKQ